MSTYIALDAALRDSPSGWERVPFCRVSRTCERANESGDALLLSLTSAGDLRPRNEDQQPPSAEYLYRYGLVDQDDLVVNPMWLAGGGIGVSRRSGAVSPEYRVYHLAPRVHPRFIHHLLRSAPYLAQYALLVRAETTFDRRVTKDDFRNLPLALPPLSVQHSIASYLDAKTARIDALIANKRSTIGLLSERRMAVTIDGVCGRFTSLEFDQSTLPWLGNRGAGWSDVKLRLVARLGSGHTPSRDRAEWWLDCTIPWITTGEVAQMRSDRIEFVRATRESISELGLANSSAERCPPGTVVLCRTASAGYSAIMGTEMATSQDFVTWTCSPLLRPRFLLLCLRAMRQDLLGRLAMGSTHKTIYMPDIEGLRIPLPSVTEQDRIVEATWSRLNIIDQITDVLQQQIDLLGEHRRSLITAAVTGALAVAGVPA